MKPATRFLPILLVVVPVLAGLALPPAGWPSHSVLAAPEYGSGLAVCAPPVQPVVLEDPTVVSDCSQVGLQAALDHGGQIAFDCGGPATIPLTSQLVLNPAVDTVIDGGGLVTLDGQDQTRILFKDWHNPDQVASVTITLQNLRLVNGRAWLAAAPATIRAARSRLAIPARACTSSTARWRTTAPPPRRSKTTRAARCSCTIPTKR